MKSIMFTVVAVLLSFQLGAQDQMLSFSLDEAIAYAKLNNYKAINAGRDIEDALKEKWEYISLGLPQIDGAVGYQNQLKQPVSLIPAEFVGGDPGDFVPIVFGTQHQATATATLKQLIFDGSYIVGVQATEAILRFSQNNKEKTDQEVKLIVVEAYGNVLLAKETVRIADNNRRTLESNLYETRKLYENGLGDEESVEQLQITLSSIESALKNAIRFEEITLQTLNLVMGLPIESPTVLTENLDALVVKQIDLGILNEDFQLENNVDYRLVQDLNERRYYELKLAKSQFLPTLNAFINYSGSGFNNEFGFLSGDQEWFGASIFGVDMNIPIFSSMGRTASKKRAEIAYAQAKTQLTETEQQVRLQLERSKSDYIFSIEEYETNKDNLDLAERIEQKNQVKYSEGLATSFELRQAQTQLYNAQRDYLQSMVDVVNRKTELETILNN